MIKNGLKRLSNESMRLAAMSKLRGDRNQCPACSEFFNSTHAFEKHKTGKIGINRRCQTVSEMEIKGMSKNDAGFWITKKSEWHESINEN